MSSNNNIAVKILLDYEVYEKLKKYEKEIGELHSKYKQQANILSAFFFLLFYKSKPLEKSKKY